MRALSDNTGLIDTVAVIGVVSSQLMNLSSIPSILEIIRAKSTLSYPSFPFAVSIISSFANIPYAAISLQWLAGLSSALTLLQNSTYELIHLRYTDNRRRIALEFGSMLLITGVAMGIGPAIKCSISSNECHDFSIDWLGVIMAIISCMRYGAQASTFSRVVRSKNSISISPPMTAGALFSSSIWAWYALLVGDPYYLASGLAGISSCLVQILFLLIYPRVFPTQSITSMNEIAQQNHAKPIKLIDRVDTGIDLERES